MRPMETSSRPWITSMLGLCLLAACAVDKTDIDSTTTMASGGTETSGDGDGDTGEPFVPVPARGDIALTQVVVNQGVDVAISNDGVWLDGTERNTYVVSDRDTLLRAYWTIPEDWLARPITARLELHYPDDTDVVYEDTKMIDGPSFAGDLDRGFWFALLAEQFPPGLEYHVSLWEAAPGAEEQRESTTIIESPIGGRQLIGAQSEPAELHVVMMPVAYNNGDDCNTNTGTEVSDAQEQLFLDYLTEQYPVQEVFLDFRRDTPIVWEQNLESLAELWAPLQDQRTADDAPPNWYYYALVNACAPGIDGAGGIAPGLAPDTKAAAFERVSSGLWLPESNDYSYHTMVHELGHNHGRAHVFCAGGDALGTDPAYPHEDGVIGVWGFGIRLFELHSPTADRDFMTYCSPNWVSDWGWTKAYDRIRTLTSWDYEGAPASDEPQGEVLIGLLLKDGSERWWTTPGGREPEHYSSGELISFEYDGETIASPTNVQILDDGNTMITAPVPRPANTFASATRMDRGHARAIELKKR